jgi:hypothetical protein
MQQKLSHQISRSKFWPAFDLQKCIGNRTTTTKKIEVFHLKSKK